MAYQPLTTQGTKKSSRRSYTLQFFLFLFYIFSDVKLDYRYQKKENEKDEKVQ
jgi:hypothetical protein